MVILLRPGRLLASISLCAAFAGCSQGPRPSVAHRADSLQLGAAYQSRCRTLEGVPTPTESAARLKRVDPVFKPKFVLAYSRIDYMTTGPLQALGLGAYAADLAYANLYNHPLEATRSLQAMERLTEHMQVADAIDTRKLADDLARGIAADSLLSRLNLALAAFNARLQARGQLDLSVLAVTGGWIEGMYLLTHHASRPAQMSLRTLAAQQKPSLDLILEAWERNTTTSPVSDSLRALLVETQTTLSHAALPEQTAGMGGTLEEDADGIMTFRAPARPEPALPGPLFDRLAGQVNHARRLIEQAGAQPFSKPTTS